MSSIYWPQDIQDHFRGSFHAIEHILTKGSTRWRVFHYGKDTCIHLFHPCIIHRERLIMLDAVCRLLDVLTPSAECTVAYKKRKQLPHNVKAKLDELGK